MEYSAQVTSTEENHEFLSIVRNIRGENVGDDMCKYVVRDSQSNHEIFHLGWDCNRIKELNHDATIHL